LPSLLRLGTFATVGVAATVGYAIIAESLAFFGLRPALASVIAYGICGLWSYLGHKRFTFASPAPHSVAAPRFVIAAAVGLLIAAGAPLLFARFFGASPYFAVLATCIVAPIVSFVASQSFVFRSAD
jgi:putative flippase GtrA